MKLNEFDEYFDKGGSVMPFADMERAERPNLKGKRVNIDFPLWMVEALDREASRLGVTRQSLVKVWIADCLSAKSAGQYPAMPDFEGGGTSKCNVFSPPPAKT